MKTVTALLRKLPSHVTVYCQVAFTLVWMIKVLKVRALFLN